MVPRHLRRRRGGKVHLREAGGAGRGLAAPVQGAHWGRGVVTRAVPAAAGARLQAAKLRAAAGPDHGQ